MGDTKPLLLVLGYRSSFDRISDALDGIHAEVRYVPEDYEGEWTRQMSGILYLFEEDTPFSSQLLSLYSYFLHWYGSVPSFIVEIEPFARIGSYEHMKGLPIVDCERIKEEISKAMGAGAV